MRKGIIVALAALAMGLTGLYASPAKGLQFGFNAGYTSVGFNLHGMGGEFLFGFQGKDEHRPQGSVIRIGLAGASGEGESDLTKATWNGVSYDDFNNPATALARLVTATTATLTETLTAAGLSGATLAGTLQTQLPAAIIEASRQAIAAGEAYGIADKASASSAKGKGTAFLVSAAYEYVLPQGAPGLGFIVGGELYVSEGGFSSSDPAYPSVSTDGGIGGGGVVGISYYTKNGFNLTIKTGVGIINPGEVTLLGVTVVPESVLYVSPTFSIGFIH